METRETDDPLGGPEVEDGLSSLAQRHDGADRDVLDAGIDMAVLRRAHAVKGIGPDGGKQAGHHGADHAADPEGDDHVLKPLRIRGQCQRHQGETGLVEDGPIGEASDADHGRVIVEEGKLVGPVEAETSVQGGESGILQRHRTADDCRRIGEHAKGRPEQQKQRQRSAERGDVLVETNESVHHGNRQQNEAEQAVVGEEALADDPDARLMKGEKAEGDDPGRGQACHGEEAAKSGPTFTGQAIRNVHGGCSRGGSRAQ